MQILLMYCHSAGLFCSGEIPPQNNWKLKVQKLNDFGGFQSP
jgi:hypothetical protein